MRTEKEIIWLGFGAGLAFWLLDSLMSGTALVPRDDWRDVYVRLAAMALFMTLATGVAIVFARGRRANEALRDSEQRYRALFEGAPDAVLLADPQTGEVLDANAAAAQLLAMPLEDILGMRLSRLHPPDAGEGDGAALPAYARQAAAGKAVRVEGVVVRRGGARVPVEITARPVRIGGAEALQCTYHDVSGPRRAKEVRERLIAELQAKNAELEQFTHTVSHDLRGPLVTIGGFLGQVERALAAGDATNAVEDIARVREAVRKMDGLLNGLLTLSRIGRGAGPPADVPLGDVAREAVDALSVAIARRGARVEIADGLPAVSGDRLRLTQVFQNLFDNAVKFAGDEPRPLVQVGARADGGMIACFVRDNGMGIEPDSHERVFGLFERLDGDLAGTGVGLAIVRRIVELHGGRAWVESEGRGKGSTFWFTLPAAGADAPRP